MPIPRIYSIHIWHLLRLFYCWLETLVAVCWATYVPHLLGFGEFYYFLFDNRRVFEWFCIDNHWHWTLIFTVVLKLLHVFFLSKLEKFRIYCLNLNLNKKYIETLDFTVVHYRKLSANYNFFKIIFSIEFLSDTIHIKSCKVSSDKIRKGANSNTRWFWRGFSCNLVNPILLVFNCLLDVPDHSLI